MLTVEVATTRDDLLALRPAWDELWAESDATVFSHFDWQFLWWQSLGRRDTPLVLVARFGDKVVGIAPFMVSGASRPWVSFLAAPMCDSCDLLAPHAPEVLLRAFLTKLMSLDNIWSRARFERMTEGSPAWRLCGLAMEQGIAHNHSSEERYAYVATPEQLADLRSEGAKPAGKRRSASHFRKHTTLERLHDADDIKSHLPNLFCMHAQRWRGTETPSRFHSAEERRFFYLLTDSLAPQGLVSLSVLSYLGEPVAYSLDLHRASTCYRYTLAYSSYYAASSPGGLLAARGNDELLGAGFSTIDYARGGHAFKQSLANTAYLTHDIEFFRNPMLQKAASLDAALRRSRAGGWVRSRPSMRAARKRVLRRVPPTLLAAAGSEQRALFALDCSRAVDGLQAGSGAAGGLAVETVVATPAELPAIGGLYGCQAASPEATRMGEWLAGGAECLVVKAGAAAVAAGWVFSGDPLSVQESPCPLLPESPAGVSVLGRLVDSPGAADFRALDSLLLAYWKKERETGRTPLVCASGPGMQAAARGIECHLVRRADCGRICEALDAS